ncbi:MAG: Ger(x)C family spore germination protein [Paenibacillus sp.]|nr:Ger(x)C family spore germination protein [Paenibacillus sp.]
MYAAKFGRKSLNILILGLFCSVLSGCWDQVEINQLAIVNLVGIDKNPDNGRYEVFYQVINPSGMSGQVGTQVKSPVYVYKEEGKHLGIAANKTYMSIPRQLFPDHYQVLVVSKKLAMEGLREFLNFTEQQTNRRASVHVVITEGPLSDIMNTFIPLERLPGRSIKSLIRNGSKQTGKVSDLSRVKDILIPMESSKLMTLPIIGLRTENPESSSHRFEQINADEGNIKFNGAAIIKHGRMIGEISLTQEVWYNLLNDQLYSLFQDVEFPDKQVVEIQADGAPKISKKLSFASGQPSLTIDIRFKLKIASIYLEKMLTKDSVHKIEHQFNKQINEQATKFLQFSKQKNWDVLGIEEQVNKKKGTTWNQAKGNPEFWKKVKVTLKIQSQVTTTGTSIHPYKGD